jgi:hypothetical protein
MRESREERELMEQAGCINSDGYRIITIDGREYFAHDLA